MEKIFIIDNEEKIRTVLSRIITLEGFELFQAYDLENAGKRCDVSGIDTSTIKEGNKIKFSVQDFGKEQYQEKILIFTLKFLEATKK